MKPKDRDYRIVRNNRTGMWDVFVDGGSKPSHTSASPQAAAIWVESRGDGLIVEIVTGNEGKGDE